MSSHHDALSIIQSLMTLDSHRPEPHQDQVLPLAIKLVHDCAAGRPAQYAMREFMTGLVRHNLIVSAERDGDSVRVDASLGHTPCDAALFFDPRPMITVCFNLEDDAADDVFSTLFHAIKEIHGRVENGLWVSSNVATRLSRQPDCVELTILPIGAPTP